MKVPDTDSESETGEEDNDSPAPSFTPSNNKTSRFFQNKNLSGVVSETDSEASSISLSKSLCRRPKFDFDQCETAALQEKFRREYTYQFFARCVALPISQSLFDPSLQSYRNKPLRSRDLSHIADKCKKYLHHHYPPEKNTILLDANSYVNAIYGRRRKFHNPEDKIILWLYCQTIEGGEGYSMIHEHEKWRLPGEHSRRNGFTREDLYCVVKTFATFTNAEGNFDVERAMSIVKSNIFDDYRCCDGAVEVLKPEFYYGLLQNLLGISFQQHLIYYNENKYNCQEDQIIRLREEAQEMAKSILMMRRRPSMQYMTEEDAQKALEEQEKNLDSFRSNLQCNNGLTQYLPDSPIPTKKRSKTTSVSRKSDYTKVNEFIIQLTIESVYELNLPDGSECAFFVTCGGNISRSNYFKVKGGEGMCSSNFTMFTTRPRPTITIELVQNTNGGLFFENEKLIARKEQSGIDFLPLINRKSEWTTISMKYKKGTEPCNIQVETLLSVKIHKSIKMIGYLEAKGGQWKKNRRNLFILCDGQKSNVEYELMGISEKGRVKRTIHRLNEYDVMAHYHYKTNDFVTDDENEEKAENKGFTLMKEGEIITFVAESERLKTMWVKEMFLLTKQTNPTDRRKLHAVKSSESQIQSPTSGTSLPSPDMMRLKTDACDLNAYQGQHPLYFRDFLNLVLDYNLEHECPGNCGKLHLAHEALLLEYQHRYGISHGFYGVYQMEAYARKYEEGYFVDPQLITQCLENLKNWVLTKEEHRELNEARQRIYHSLQHIKDKIFRKFPYNMGEYQLFAHTILLKDLHKQYDAENFHTEEDLILDSIEKSMLYEYQQHIAPQSLLSPLDQTNDNYREIAKEEREKLLAILWKITSKVIMFIENFIAFYTKFLFTYSKLIEEKDVKRLLESFLDFYNHDLEAIIKHAPNTLATLEIYQTLNNFCHEKAPYLTFGEFHKNSLHEAFCFHISFQVEQKSNKIIGKADADFKDEIWQAKESRAVKNLKRELKDFQNFIQQLEWPNPDFNATLQQMVDEKTKDIIVKYGRYIAELVNNKEFTRENLKKLNHILALYSTTPNTIEPDNDDISLDKVVGDAIRDITLPVIAQLDKVLGEFNCGKMSKIFFKLVYSNRVKTMGLFLRHLGQNILPLCERTVHSDFLDCFLIKFFSEIITRIYSWLQKTAVEQEPQVKINVISKVVSRIVEIFRKHIRFIWHEESATEIRERKCPMQLKTPEYNKLNKFLSAEEIKLEERDSYSKEVRQEIYRILEDSEGEINS